MIRYHRSLNHKQCRLGIARGTLFSSRAAPYAKAKSLGSGGSMIARLKLKGIDGKAQQGVEPAAQFDSTRVTLVGQDSRMIDRSKLFLDLEGGGAWPFLVGGLICLVNSVNERDLDLLTSPRKRKLPPLRELLRGTNQVYWLEVRGNNRSVVPLDVLRCTRATMGGSTGFNPFSLCGKTAMPGRAWKS